jgi:glycosyltransferase involved in cell wall biosynthesis
MSKSPPKIGLCCIVKDESKVIERALKSALPLIDYALIVDTGSTDGTQEIMKKFLSKHKVPHDIIEENWENFAHNRTSALRHLRKRKDVKYGITLDADEVFKIPDNFDKAKFAKGLKHDAYRVYCEFGEMSYHRYLIFRNNTDWVYRGVVHEFLECETKPASIGDNYDIKLKIFTDGNRSKDEDKYKKDAEILRKALDEEEDPFMKSRYTFYTAQSYKDCGNNEKAIEYYSRRTSLGYWSQEIFESYYSIAKIKRSINTSVGEVVEDCLLAFKSTENRLEAIHEIVNLYRLSERYRAGYEIGKNYLDFEIPKDSLFLRPDIYQWRFDDEVSVCAYWAGHYKHSLKLCKKVLASPFLPEREKERVKANLKFAEDAIPPSA